MGSQTSTPLPGSAAKKTCKSDAEENMEAEVAVRWVPDKSSLVCVTLGELAGSEQAVAESLSLGLRQADE